MILHVACLPFPTYQGTQAAVDAMLRASVHAGHRAQLLTYAHGAYEIDAPYDIHRVADFPRVRGLRSGPSWGKVALDARCILEIRRLARQERPKAIVAHHIEAALAALAAQAAPVYFVAHTALARELPVYFPALPAKPVSRIAQRVEALVCAQATGVAAVAPALARLLGERRAHYLPVPWKRSDEPRLTRREARAALSLDGDAQTCLYAGNLDRYQGWEYLIDALSLMRRHDSTARLLVATESDPGLVRQRAARAGVGHAVHVRRLDGERSRELVHAASDLAWIPRRTEGGLPIKMLDAFARGLPVVAMERAGAELPLGSACSLVPNDDPTALAKGAANLLDDPSAANGLRDEARRYLATHHSDEAFAVAMSGLLTESDATQPATHVVPRRSTA